MKYFCCKCEDEVTIPKGAERMATKIKIVCDECVEDLEGTRFGDFFEEEVDEEDNLHDNGSQTTVR